MRYKNILTIAAGLLITATLSAQNLTDLRVAEIVAENESGLVDDYGERSGWIEIFNTSYGTVNYGGCYLTNDRSDLKMYRIPNTDKSTSLKPRQSVVFFAGGKGENGTYYTNFTIERGQTIYLVSNDGRTIIDELKVPEDLQADKSVKKVPVGRKEMDFEIENNSDPSPRSYNGDLNAKSKSQIMKEKDPHGWTLTLISVLTVFIALTILAFIFTWIGNYQKKDHKPKKEKKASSKNMSPEVAAAITMALSQEYGGEVYAAIALALDDYIGGGVHDAESYVITIKPTPGSQWNEKTQNFRQLPRK
jgi:Na+-transporting methylmalonyl-CoA/oxaloacetate decarboxylase gamma subunit/type II secretory pathway pseudopilin PulG